MYPIRSNKLNTILYILFRHRYDLISVKKVNFVKILFAFKDFTIDQNSWNIF